MTEPNPYAPPGAALAPPTGDAPVVASVPTYKLYTPGQATLAAFLGSPLAGLYLISMNRRRLGLAQAARNTLIGGFVATAALVAVGFGLPDNLTPFLPIAATITIAQYARQDTPLLTAHLTRGGKKESGWKAAGIGLAALVALLVIIVAVLMVTGFDPGD